MRCFKSEVINFLRDLYHTLHRALIWYGGWGTMELGRTFYSGVCFKDTFTQTRLLDLKKGGFR